VESPLHELAPADLRVIETLRYDPGTESDGGFCRLRRHLARAERTCARLHIVFDRRACAAALQAAVSPGPGGTLRCRLTLDRAGRPEVTVARLEASPTPWRVRVSAIRLASGDPWLAVKTTKRQLYDDARAGLPSGVDEVIFLNEADAVCEGTITNVFAKLDGRLVTPPLRCGLLPGVLREEMLERGEAVERPLRLEELQRAVALFVGNSLRGLIPAQFA